MNNDGRSCTAMFGLILEDQTPPPPPTVFRRKSDPRAVAVEVHSVRSAIRRTPRGSKTELVVEITQSRRGYFDPEKQKLADASDDQPKFASKDFKEDFIYRAGCTVLIDPIKMKIRRVIRTRGNIANDEELKRMRKFLCERLEVGNSFDSVGAVFHSPEPFAVLHRANQH
jgi:hypothetical protein